ncbi:MAG: NVEALA domain-containing protein [Prevotellaceae bacterium]|jgi:hypothetical protein|nr:NVEALA domain-containing protein [Prevotellaceae bacterium]
MKRKIFFISITVAVIAVVTVWNVSLNSHKTVFSDVQLANIEALISEVTTTGCCHGDGTCINSIDGNIVSIITNQYYSPCH